MNLEFLDASWHLFEGRSVAPSVRWSDGPLVTCFDNAKNERFSLGKSSGRSNFDIAECAGCTQYDTENFK